MSIKRLRSTFFLINHSASEHPVSLSVFITTFKVALVENWHGEAVVTFCLGSLGI